MRRHVLPTAPSPTTTHLKISLGQRQARPLRRVLGNGYQGGGRDACGQDSILPTAPVKRNDKVYGQAHATSLLAGCRLKLPRRRRREEGRDALDGSEYHVGKRGSRAGVGCLMMTRLVDWLESGRLASNLVFPLSQAADRWQFQSAQGGVESGGKGWGSGKPENGVSVMGKQRQPMTNEAIDVSRQAT